MVFFMKGFPSVYLSSLVSFWPNSVAYVRSDALVTDPEVRRTHGAKRDDMIGIQPSTERL